MGAFYGNITLKGPSQSEVAEALRGRKAVVAPKLGDSTVLFDSACDAQEVDEIQALASGLSRKFDCAAFAVIVHDDDVLAYFLFRSSKLVDWYHSCPNYFDFGSKERPADPVGGNAAELATTFGAGEPKQLETILRKGSGKRGYVVETDRHRDLVSALGLPTWTIGNALGSFEGGECPKGLTAKQMVWAADPPSPKEDRKRREDRKFYTGLGREDVSRPCKQAGCNRGAIQNSVLCRRHHFEMVTGQKCPFED